VIVASFPSKYLQGCTLTCQEELLYGSEKIGFPPSLHNFNAHVILLHLALDVFGLDRLDFQDPENA